MPIPPPARPPTRPERREAPPARLFFGVVTAFEAVFEAARARIAERFGPLEEGEESPLFPFPPTRTYGRTMGLGPLLRKFFFLRRHWPQDALAPVKLSAMEIEERIAREGGFPVPRPVNIDPGLLNDCRIILASTKDHAHRIYRGSGIWEEVTLIYRERSYRPLPWTYPDFQSPRYGEYFAPIRERYLAGLGACPENPTPVSGPPPPPAPSSPPPP